MKPPFAVPAGSIGLALGVLLLSGCATSSSTPSPVPADGTFSFWPPPPDEPRIQFLTSYRYSSDVEAPQSVLDEIVFGKDRVILPIGKPYGVAAWKGRLYVCDVTNPGVVILDLESNETRLMGVRGVEVMRQPVDLDIAPDGTKYVVDRVRGKIFVYDADDRYVMSLGEPGLVPVGVAVRGRELLVPDFQTQSVLVMDRLTGETISSIGEAGGEDGQFVRPLGVATDARGRVYVTDAISGRLQAFEPDGTLAFSVGELTYTGGNFVRPKHVAVDADGIVYVVDAAFQNVQMFDEEGHVLMYFGSPGSHAGSMSLPAGIAVMDGGESLFGRFVHPAFEAQRFVIVTNQFGLHKVAIYALGRLREGYSVADIAPQMAKVEPEPFDDDGGDVGQETLPGVAPVAESPQDSP